MPLIARQRSRLAVLAVVALVGSLLAVSAVPVAAEHTEPGFKTDHTACIGPATEESPGFTDTVGNTHEHAIDCLAYYGITTGKTLSTYDPNTAITRSQMALFLHRAAAPAGVNLPTTVTDQGLIDISGHAQDEINQIVELGIMEPRTNMTFNPNDHVTRADMAQHLHAFLGLATPGPGAYGGNADEDKYENVTIDDNPFTDINNETKNAYDAILHIYELGITEGQTHTTYNPTGPVTRAQMASFITRTMDHTNTRPTGLTIQGLKNHYFTDDTIEPVWVSVRDAKFLPVNEAAVDSFYHKTGGDIKPFNDNGNCNDVVMDGCDDLGGYLTDSEGNFALPLTPTINGSPGDYRVYIWTGQDGETFDSDDHSVETADIEVTNSATKVKVTTTHGTTQVGDDDPKPGDLAKFGETVTVTIQLQDGEDENVPDEEKILISIVKQLGTDGTDQNVVSPEMESSTEQRTTDDDGKIEISFTKVDPNPGTDDRMDRGKVTVTIPGTDTNNLQSSLVGEENIVVTIIWEDAKSVATDIELTPNKDYFKLPKDGKSNARVSAKVLDQYGEEMPGLRVNFRSSSVPVPDSSNGVTTDLGDDDDGVHEPERTSLPISYSVDKDATHNPGATQSFGAFYDPDDDEDKDPLTGYVVRVGLDASDNSVDDASESLKKIYWAIDATLSEILTGNVALADIDENTIVVTRTGGALYVTYDSDDQFTIDTHTAEVGSDPIPAKNVLLSEFEKALKDGQGTLTWTNNEDDSGAGVNRFTYAPPDAS